MTAEKRNTAVVVFLILSLTVGAKVLLWLLPQPHQYAAPPLLMAETAAPLEEIEIDYVADLPEAEAVVESLGAVDGCCLVYPDQTPELRRVGPRMRVLVIAPGGKGLGDWQKKTLFRVLGSLNSASGQNLVPMRLGVTLAGGDDLAPAARELCDLLVAKQIIVQ